MFYSPVVHVAVRPIKSKSFHSTFVPFLFRGSLHDGGRRVFRRRAREHPGDLVEAALPLPVPGRALHRQDRRPLRLQSVRPLHAFQVGFKELCHLPQRFQIMLKTLPKFALSSLLRTLLRYGQVLKKIYDCGSIILLMEEK